MLKSNPVQIHSNIFRLMKIERKISTTVSNWIIEHKKNLKFAPLENFRFTLHNIKCQVSWREKKSKIFQCYSSVMGTLIQKYLNFCSFNWLFICLFIGNNYNKNCCALSRGKFFVLRWHNFLHCSFYILTN